ncbi:uncharacterized protein LOC130818503 [Amaranthus tricolor]|uniref:uncharacterized protein LOC130818503 n=1 Tax=Amaranthus tricolor TaxID=29722 RepID=UPI0025850C3A|nr:uncharacterized protein LOC130818503 [Amaranthus tricolor]
MGLESGPMFKDHELKSNPIYVFKPRSRSRSRFRPIRSQKESENSAALYGDFDGEDDILMEVDALQKRNLPHGSIKKTTEKFGYSQRTISYLWNKVEKQKQTSQKYDLDHSYHKCGRKRITVPYKSIVSIQMGDRTCIRDLAKISEDNKLVRIHWMISLLVQDSIPIQPQYKCLYDFVHIDEKWFYLSRKSQRLYLAKNKPKPYRSCKSSKFIPKIMFMCCVARPRWNQQGECTFDGKIRIFPFTEEVLMKRASKNRPMGCLKQKP